MSNIYIYYIVLYGLGWEISSAMEKHMESIWRVKQQLGVYRSLSTRIMKCKGLNDCKHHLVVLLGYPDPRP